MAAPNHTNPPAGGLLIISGPSGVGKTTITRAVEAAIPGAVFSVSATTRPVTPADKPGVDYFFVNDAQFDDLIARGELLEWARVFDRRYGTPRQWVQDRLAEGKLVILEVDVVGAASVKQQIPAALAVFVLPPDEATLLERLRGRKREPEEAIQKRFAEAKREIEAAKRGNTYSHFVVNRDLNEAVRETVDIVRRELPFTSSRSSAVNAPESRP